MTSPFIKKPEPTNPKYDDIHTQGSTYGQDLKNESQVRELLKSRIESPLQDVFNKFTRFTDGVIGGIADAIRGDSGDARFGPVAGAVNERMDPINNAITESGERHTELASKVDGIVLEQESLVEQAGEIQESLQRVDSKASDAVSNAQSLIDSQSEFNAKVQPQINQALADSDAALAQGYKLLADSDALHTQFEEEQVRVNKVTQEQLWAHQDMLELLDIRSPKTYFSLPGYSTVNSDGSYTKWTNPYSGVAANRIEKPFTTTYEEPSSKGVTVYIACKGNWTGQVTFHANWDEGQLDEWTFEVTKDNRVFKYTGGAWHIKPRFYTVTVYPESLRRKCYTRIRDGWDGEPSSYSNTRREPKHFDVYSDPEGFIRLDKSAYIRFKNICTCDKGLYIRDNKGFLSYRDVGQYIIPTMIFPEDQTHLPAGTELVFSEVGDEISKDWTISQNKPGSGSTVVNQPY